MTILDKRGIYIEEAINKLAQLINPRRQLANREPRTRIELVLDLPRLDIKRFLLLLSGVTLIGINAIRLISVHSGSVVLTIEMPLSAADRLLILVSEQNRFFSQYRLKSLRVIETIRIYRNAFLCYAEEDEKWVNEFRSGQLKLGFDFIEKANSTFANQGNKQQLARAIDEADVFILFWSDNTVRSNSARIAYEYALATNGTEDFIRPIYWQSRLPNPPELLSHLHFQHISPKE